MRTNLSVLKDLRRLFDVPSNWIQGSPASTDSGAQCRPESIFATCWCLMGGVSKVTSYSDELEEYDAAIESVHRSIKMLGFENGIAAWNDDNGRTYQDVLAMVDQCIEFERIKIQ